MASITTHQLTRFFGKLEAVRSLDLEAFPGEVLGFLGPNGAGKTTTIRMLAGIIAPTSGYATIAGRRTDGDPSSLHEVVGLLTESPGFYNRLSAYRNLLFYADFYPAIRPEIQVEKYLRLMGLWERKDDLAGTFSKGMKQRLALARALLHEPPVLLLDEPTAGLDPEAAGEVRSLISKLSGEGRTIFLSTHNLSEAEELCRRIAIFRSHLVALDTPENLRRRVFSPQTLVRFESVGQPLVEALRKLPIIQTVEAEGNLLKIRLSPEGRLPDVVEAAVRAGGRILEVSEDQHSLEEVYLNLVKEEKQKA